MIHERIDMDVVIKNTKLHLYVDSSLIEQTLINLLLNAMEATKDVGNPHINLTVQDFDNAIYIRIKDNGVGISPEQQEQIFSPFFTAKKRGSGIGLALTKEVMLLPMGNVLLESQEGQGSVFTLKFPKI